MNKPVLLDTDILSNLMKKHPQTVISAEKYLKKHKQFCFSVITKYEILRGLKAKRAEKQIERFQNFCRTCAILPIESVIVDRAAGIYADLRSDGITIGDADILIAATALENGFELATNNASHFRHIKTLEVTNWML